MGRNFGKKEVGEEACLQDPHEAVMSDKEKMIKKCTFLKSLVFLGRKYNDKQ
jgi:hypothetical protein